MTTEEFRKVLNEHRENINRHRAELGIAPITDEEIERTIDDLEKSKRGELSLPKSVWES